MTTALRYRLFRRPRPPAELAHAAQGPGVLLHADGVSIRIVGRSIRLPGVRSSRSGKLSVGSVVVTRDRVLLAVSRWVLVDAPLNGPDAGGPQRVTFAADGVRLEIDVPTIHDAGQGTFTLRYTVELSPSELAQLPAEVAVTVTSAVPLLLRSWS